MGEGAKKVVSACRRVGVSVRDHQTVVFSFSPIHRQPNTPVNVPDVKARDFSPLLRFTVFISQNV
jgi:hypothetical protein